jgi:phage terminase large subunit-like protein
MEKVKSVLERTHSISRKTIATCQNLSSNVYRVLTNSMGKTKVCAKWTPHVLIDYQRSMSVFLASTHLQRCRYEENAFFDRISADEGL